MALSYSWSFPVLDVIYDEDGLDNVVTTVHWVYTAQDGDYSAQSYGTVALAPPGQPFISYDDLTEEIVTGWVVSAMGAEQVSAMDVSLAAQINAQKNPTGGPLPPPWSQ
jgi:hypothetical protein